MTVILTGATGFIGGHLARRLITEQEAVHAIVRSTSDVTRIPDGVVSHIHDGTAAGLCEILKCVQPDIVFHIAGQFVDRHTIDDIGSLINSNITFGVELAESMVRAGTTRLVMAGTSWQYFAGPSYAPVNLYAATKQAVEAVLRYYVDAEGLRIISLKLFDTYGPGDTRGKIWSRLVRMRPEDPALPMSPGGQLIDLVHIDDAVTAFVTAAQRLRDDLVVDMEDYAVCTGDLRSLREIVNLIEKTLHRPIHIDWGGRPYRPREVMIPWSHGASLPGWQALVRLEDGIKTIMDSNV